MTTPTTPPSAVDAGTLRVDGATLYYEVRGAGPVLLLTGAPMAADQFAPLADLLADTWTVVTTDPRGLHHSSVDDPEADSTPDDRARDLAALIRHVDGGPAVVLGSSGGAVSTLALLQREPDLVRLAIAHEPPLDLVLPDAENMSRQTEQIIATYAGGDRLGAWRLFLAQAGFDMPDAVFEQIFGGERSQKDLADERFERLHMLRGTTYWVPDAEALRRHADRLVVGIGDDSAGMYCDRTARAVAALAGVEPVLFPGGHVGFADDPGAFAARLREVLRERA